MARERHLEGQTILVTGAARGMGAEHCRLFSKLGANIVAGDMLPLVHEVVAEINASGGKATAVIQDITVPEQCEQAVRTAVDTYGTLHGVVHNAAVNLTGMFIDAPYELWDKTMKINAYGTYNVAKAAWPVLVKQNYGRLVFIGASSTMTQVPNMAAYNASKGVSIGLSNSLSIEGEPHNITSNVILPAAVSPMIATGFDEETQRKLAPKLRVEWVSPVVAWLMRPENKVNGKLILACSSRAAQTFHGWNVGYESKDINIDELIENEAAVFDKQGSIEVTSYEHFMDWILR